MTSSSFPGEWRDYRCDDSRAGVQIMPARSGPLKARWSIRIGGSYQEVYPVPDASGDLLMADGGGIQRLSANGDFRWRTKPFGAHWIRGAYDLDDDGELEILTSNGREILILSAVTGEILFRDVVGPPHSYGTYAPMFQVHSFNGRGMQILVPCFSSKEVLMYDCSGGAPNTRVLHRLWMDDSYHPSIAIADVNHDGTDEIVIARLGGVYGFDPRSGKMVSQTLWQSDEQRRRNYGHFELVDVNNDGNLEAVILSDKVSRHIAVLGNDGHGNFYPLWDRLIEHIYPADTTELRYTSNSIRDFDGNGKMEIAVSIFNDEKDGTWHTELLRAETGENILDLPDHYLRGVQDVNGDGLPDLCLSHENSRDVKAYSTTSVYSPTAGKELWSMENARFLERAVYPASHFSEFKPDVFATHEIWSGGFVSDRGVLVDSKGLGLSLLNEDLQLSSFGFTSEQPYRVALMEHDRILVSQANGELLQVTKSGTQHFLSCGYHLTTEAHIAARPGLQPTVFIENGKHYLACPDFSGAISIYENRGMEEPELVATIHGRSRIGYDGIFHAASVIQTEAGARIVIVDDKNEKHARLSLYTSDGVRTHTFEFPDMPPSQLGNRIGCYDWLYFEHSRGEALMASFYQSPSMNSECSLAFLIESGAILWRNERIGVGEYGRGVGPWGTTALMHAKNDDEKNPIAIFCAKDTLCYLDLETGEFVGIPKLLTDYTADAMRAANKLKEQSLSTTSSIEDPFTAYGTPILNNDDLIVGGCFGGFGVLEASPYSHVEKKEARWWKVGSFGDVLYRLPGIADIDGDGKLELGQGHADGFFRVYDYETGSLRCEFDLNAISTDVLAVGANNGERMEFVFGTNDGRLITVGYNGKTIAILNELDIGAALGSPIAADLDGDGNSEIIVATASGDLLSFA